MTVPVLRSNDKASRSAPSLKNPPTDPSSSKSQSLLQSLVSHRAALRVTALVMLLFGVLGTLSPSQLYQEMMGTSPITPVSDPTRFYMALFAIREVVMALWLTLATVYFNDAACRFLLYSVLFLLMPFEAFLWITAHSFVASDVVAKNLTNQAVFVAYLLAAAWFGK